MKAKNEWGAAVVQLTILVPALMLMLMLVVQFALMLHARNIAEQAAQEGAAQARKFDGSAAVGHERAMKLLATTTGTLRDATVDVARTTDSASATVSGRVVSVVPFLHLTVSESAEGPVEKYVPLRERP